jgi:hypothetical protein
MFTAHEFKHSAPFVPISSFRLTIIPAAFEAGAAEWIDYMASNSPELAAIYHGGFGWLDHESRRRYAADFVDGKPEQQTAILGRDRLRKNETPENAPGIHFFTWVRNMVTDAYYTSPGGHERTGVIWQYPPRASSRCRRKRSSTL